MQRNQIIKDIIAGLILGFSFPLFYLIEHYNLIKNKTIFNILFNIFGLIGTFLIFGIFSYICFKIMRGTTFIYKDPNQAKTLNNVDFWESRPDSVFLDFFGKSIYYGKELPEEKNYYLKKFFSFYYWMLLIVFIMFLIKIFVLAINKNQIYNTVFDIFFYFFLFVLCPLLLLFIFCKVFDSFWCYYVKLFQLLGIFRFLKSDFNKTINSHNYFPISIYYKKSKKPKTIRDWLFWFIFIVIAFIIFGGIKFLVLKK